MKFCPLCGKKAEKLAEGFCSECFKKKFEPNFKTIKIKQCASCQKVFQKNKWDKIKIESIVEKQLKQAEKHAILKEINEKEIIASVHDVLFVVPLELEKLQCNICSPRKTYFEGKLQLRNVNDKIISFAKQEISNAREKGIFVSKEEKVKGGIDIYLSDKKYIQHLGRKLRDKYGGILKVSAQLFSVDKQTGKEIYRVNVLFKPVNFEKGNTIIVGGEKIKVTSIGKEVFGVDENNKKVHIPLERLGNYKVL